MATKKTHHPHGPVSTPKSRKEWVDAVEDGTKTKQQAIARCKHMISKKGDSFHGKQWSLFLAKLTGKPKASPKAVATFTKPKASAKTKAKPLSIQVADEVELEAMKIMLAQLRAAK